MECWLIMHKWLNVILELLIELCCTFCPPNSAHASPPGYFCLYLHGGRAAFIKPYLVEEGEGGLEFKKKKETIYSDIKLESGL